jgi:Holliday junction DNA helicase RuvA
MISTIEGILRARDGNRIVVEIGGVGFEVAVPLRVAESLGDEGERVRLHTYLHVREDTLALYGFPDESERHLFLLLIGVSGVGPRLALSVLALTGAGELARIIHEEKAKALVSIPGIGKKTAERIVLELKDKIELERYLPAVAAAEAGMPRELFEEAVTALESIGLSRANAIKALERVDVSGLGSSYRVEDLVREALKAI